MPEETGIRGYFTCIGKIVTEQGKKKKAIQLHIALMIKVPAKLRV